MEKFLFFWGHQEKAIKRTSKLSTKQPPMLEEKQVSKAVLSQWYPANFVIEGQQYLNAEQYMMAEKARLFQDEACRERILAADNPALAKKLGREIRHFDEATWVAHRYEIVVRGNFAKFSQNPALADFLIQTGKRVLVEASPVDPIWGIGLAEDDPKASKPEAWRGLNLLGKALMDVRAQLL